jgi:BirA family biotin operon repressor/biotin-[acetyl-CoA-carboxylase] ligase
LPLPFVGHSVGSPFIELQSIDSTNNYALAQIHANLAQAGACFFAHEQTAGKGQRGKSWATEKGSNISLSIVLKPSFLQVFQQFRLSTCVAVAARRFLSDHGGDAISIKWPNDVYWKNSKIAGILIENIARASESTEGRWEWAVVGIGVNVNQTEFPSGLKNPVSLTQITGKNYNTIDMAKQLCRCLDHFYNKLVDEKFDLILEEYNAHLYKKNEVVKFKMENRIFEARVKAVNEVGQLVVEHAIEARFDFGKVEWII